MKLALNNGKAFVKGKIVKVNILIEDAKIVRIRNAPIDADREIDCSGKLILPAGIDAHVHFRTPGLEYKEDWMSGSLAALHGGVTTVMDMPNTNPPTDSLERMLEKRRIIAKEASANYDIYMAATESNLSEIEKATLFGLRAVKLYFGSTTGDILLNKHDAIEKLFVLAKKKDFVVAAHAEDEDEIRKNMQKFSENSSPAVHEKIRSDLAESKAVEALLQIQKKIGNKLHIAHLSCAKALALIKKAKRGKFGKNITCEVTPNHLLLDNTSYKKLGNLIKCNPSIKSPRDRKALLQGLKSGAIDIVATDHAPHSEQEKAQPYSTCPSGIPGVETMIPLILDMVNKKQLTLARAVDAVSERPAKIFNWKTKGKIEEGFDADLVIVDMKKNDVLENSELFTKAKYTPFAGRRLKGFVEKTIVGGVVFG